MMIGMPMNPALPKISAAWNTWLRDPSSRNTHATKRNTRISRAYITAVSSMTPQLASTCARSAPAMAFENTSNGISTLSSSEHMPASAVWP